MRAVVPLTVLVIGLAGCSSGSSEPTNNTDQQSSASASPGTSESASNSGAGTVTAAELCGSVSADAVSAITGGAPKPEVLSQAGVVSCEWKVDGDNKLSVAYGSKDTFGASFASLEPTSENVDGVGDSAYVSPGYDGAKTASVRGASLWVENGDGVYVVAGVEQGGAPDTAQLTAVAEQVLP